MAPKLTGRAETICHCGLYSLVLFSVLALKVHYRTAGADQLTWILGPTAMVVERLSGLAFLKEAGSGYLNVRCGILIAPACAGVNFMILCAGLYAVCGIRRPISMRSKVLWVLLMPAVAFSLTVLINAFRITLSIRIYQMDGALWGLTPGGLHRVAGSAVYFFCLWLFYMLLHHRRRLGRTPHQGLMPKLPPTVKTGLVPLGGYWLITIIVPALKAVVTGGGGARGLERHIFSVFWVSVGLFGALQVMLGVVGAVQRRYASRGERSAQNR